MFQLFVIVLVIGLPSLIVFSCYKTVKKLGSANGTLVLANVFSLILFFLSIGTNQFEFYEKVVSTEVNYTPFASPHALSLFTFLALSFAALCLIWIRKNALPPLLLVTAISLIIIGATIHAGIIIHTLGVSENVIIPTDASSSGVQHSVILCFFPLIYLATAGIILARLMKNEFATAKTRNYQSALLNRLNTLLANRQYQPLWALLLALPLFLLVTLILVLFGQDSHAITKVFTETTTWHFSTKSHPPILDHQGHYLCTVAACGDEQVVKPLGWGKRHGYPILVNRQLQVANAFEELLQDHAPRLHKLIRKWYDDYGYPLSQKITSAKRSNLTYRLMKPLEYFFLLTLYLCCVKPEEKIMKQYSMN